jgi:hypothetical protein
LAELYEEGLTLRQIASRTGVPRETARLIIHKLGVPTRHKPVTYHPPESTLTPDVALLLGLHAGDGWVTNHEWGLRFAIVDVRLVNSTKGMIRNVLGVEPVVSLPGDRSVMLRSGQPQVLDFFLSYGFPRGKKARTVTVPQRIRVAESKDLIRSFLRGLFSADGSFSYRGRSASCTLAISSLGLRDGFVELAKDCGFAFHRYTSLHKGGHNKVPLQIASISKRDEVKRWMEQIGSMSDAHRRRYAEWRRNLV